MDLTLRDLAKITGKHPETLRRLARTQQLPGAYRLGGRWMISREAASRLRQLPPDNDPRANRLDAALLTFGQLVAAIRAADTSAREVATAELRRLGFDLDVAAHLTIQEPPG